MSRLGYRANLRDRPHPVLHGVGRPPCEEWHEENALVRLGKAPACEPEQRSAAAAARLAAVLFAGDAAIGLLTLGLVPDDLHDREVIAAVSVGSASIALALARLLPWQRWPFGSLLWAFAPLYVVELGARASVGPTIGLSVRDVLAFVWLGLFFRPRAAVPGAAAVLGAILLGAILLGGGDGIEPLQLRGLLMAVPVWVFVAIVLAQLQRRRREAEQLAERAFHGAPIGVALVGRRADSADRLLRSNAALLTLLHRDDEEVTRLALSDLVVTDDRPLLEEALAGLGPAQPRGVEVRLAVPGPETWALLTLSRLEASAQSQARLVVHVQDVTERRAVQAELTHRSLHDSLTGLPNRGLFTDRLEHAIARARRDRRRVGVLFIDLDRFKTVNDSLGHAAGDRVLAGAAQRLHGALRPGDTAARIGGDEFVVLCDQIDTVEEASAVAVRLKKELARPFTVDGVDVVVTASIGIATSDGRPSLAAGRLLRDADTAMYRAKRRGRNRFEVHDEAMRASALDSLHIETELRSALEHPDEHFDVYYQPIIDLDTKAILSVEALVRWRHPRRGLLLPEAFLPVAEESNLIIALGGWVLRGACRDIAALRRGAAAADVNLSVNISPRQLGRSTFVAHVREALVASGLPPPSLCLEITENTLINVIGSVRADLPALRTLGVRLAIDDFGVGYSSLSYLNRLRLDVLKIDRTFVEALPGDATLATAIVRLAEALHLDSIAEGVENDAQAQALRRTGCRYAQGYLFFPPVPGEALADLIVTHPA